MESLPRQRDAKKIATVFLQGTDSARRYSTNALSDLVFRRVCYRTERDSRSKGVGNR